MSTSLPQEYIVLLSGTHVTGKDTIAVSLSTSLSCPWLKGDQIHTSSLQIAKSQAKRGHEFSTVYGKTWFTKMQRIGLMSEGYESDGEAEDFPLRSPKSGNPKIKIKGNGGEGACKALVTTYALRKESRDAFRDVMSSKGVRTIFVILQITKHTLSGRTLGAEEPELAERIMEEKVEDLEVPVEGERDVIVVDSMQGIDALTVEIEERIRMQVEER
jgi:gluconate kinase